MPHSKKKAGILTTATSTAGASIASISSGAYVEGAALLAISGALFALYERYQVKEIEFNSSQAEQAAEFVSDTVDSVTDKRASDKKET